MNFLELLYKKEQNIPTDFLINEIDVESYLSHTFMDVYVVQNRVLRLNKVFFTEIYSIKSLLLIHLLRIKEAINLLLSYTWLEKKIYLF